VRNEGGRNEGRGGGGVIGYKCHPRIKNLPREFKHRRQWYLTRQQVCLIFFIFIKILNHHSFKIYIILTKKIRWKWEKSVWVTIKFFYFKWWFNYFTVFIQKFKKTPRCELQISFVLKAIYSFYELSLISLVMIN
jgi:hypothetical protein